MDFLKDTVILSSIENVVKLIPDDTIHLTFTSPPYYNAMSYATYPSYTAYLDFLEKTFTEVHRITKEGRFLVVNTSPVLEPRSNRCRMSKRHPIPFDLNTILQRIGWDFIDDIIWLKPDCSVKNRIGNFMQNRKPLAYKPNAVTEYLMVYRKRTDNLIDWNIAQYSQDTINKSKVPDGFERTNVWQIAPRSDKFHPAVFPLELCNRVIQYYSYEGDTVFDPFAGSGTVGKSAIVLNRHFLLVERDKRYFNYIKDQLSTPSLFDDKEIRFITDIGDYNNDKERV